MSKFNFMYLVYYYDNGTKDVEHIVYRSSSLKNLFNEIVDLLGEKGEVYQIERLYVTDLDVVDIIEKEGISDEL